MKKFLFIIIIVGLLIPTMIAFSEVIEETLEAEKKAGYDVSLYGDGRESVVHIPKSWGSLKGVTAHGKTDILYFEASDGTIYVVQGAPEERGGYFLKKWGVAKILRK